MSVRKNSIVNLYSFTPLSFSVEEIGDTNKVVVKTPLYFLVSSTAYYKEEHEEIFVYVRNDIPFEIVGRGNIDSAEKIATYLLANISNIVNHFGECTIEQVDASMLRRLEAQAKGG